MARYNKIFLGPTHEVTPQVVERQASVAIKPGCLVVMSSNKFALAGAATVGKVWIAQDNYLALKGVDDAWAADDTMIGMELLTSQLFAGRIANGTNITAVGTPLTPAANGLLAIASTSDLIVAYSEEIYNNNTGAEQLIRIRPAGLSYLSAAT